MRSPTVRIELTRLRGLRLQIFSKFQMDQHFVVRIELTRLRGLRRFVFHF